MRSAKHSQAVRSRNTRVWSIAVIAVILILLGSGVPHTRATAAAAIDAGTHHVARGVSSAPPLRLRPQTMGVAMARPDWAHTSAIIATRMMLTRVISVPFGFASPLVLNEPDQRIFVDGHGGCAAGQEVTVAITITQSLSGAQANGQTQATCTGELQQWHTSVMAAGAPFFIPGAASACGLATTRADGQVTDTFEWCRSDVTLVVQTYLPLIIRETTGSG